ncbi:hypothetical protein V1478_015460 [Vespula squamosa]|uniref:Uncharacterized protein n=1 Tax=Vespula squamosa TaxID=30214 RepID=A0ABD2A605_VESSQ
MGEVHVREVAVLASISGFLRETNRCVGITECIHLATSLYLTHQRTHLRATRIFIESHDSPPWMSQVYEVSEQQSDRLCTVPPFPTIKLRQVSALCGLCGPYIHPATRSDSHQTHTLIRIYTMSTKRQKRFYPLLSDLSKVYSKLLLMSSKGKARRLDNEQYRYIVNTGRERKRRRSSNLEDIETQTQAIAWGSFCVGEIVRTSKAKETRSDSRVFFKKEREKERE